MEHDRALSVGFTRNAVYVNRAKRDAGARHAIDAGNAKRELRVGEAGIASLDALHPALMQSVVRRLNVPGALASKHPMLRIDPDRFAHLVAHKAASELPLRPLAFNNAAAVVNPAGTSPITISLTRDVTVVALEWDSATADSFRIRSFKLDRYEPNLTTEDMAATLFSSSRDALRTLDTGTDNAKLTNGQAITFTAVNIGPVALIPSGAVWVIDENGGC